MVMNFQSHECVIFLISTEIGTHENEGIYSICRNNLVFLSSSTYLIAPLSSPPATTLTDSPSDAAENARQLILVSGHRLEATGSALMVCNHRQLPGPSSLTEAMSPRVGLTATTLTPDLWLVMDLTRHNLQRNQRIVWLCVTSVHNDYASLCKG